MKLPRTRNRKTTTYSKNLTAYGFYKVTKNENTINQVNSKLKEAAKSKPKRITSVAYRDDGSTRGKGAHFDHRTIQQITESKTAIVRNEQTTEHLNEYLGNHVTQRLPYSEQNPPTYLETQGLLFIPGIPRDIKNSPQAFEPRTEMNKELIQDAINRGKPILAVCGGSWEVWKFFGGQLTDVKDHCSSRMPSLNTTGKVGYNIQVHRIEPTKEGSILKGAMSYEKNKHNNPYPSVNSVHWLAPDPNTVPDNLEISAYSLRDDILAPNHRHGNQMKPEENVIECFESKSGAPILGVQWHPEAYTANSDAKFYPEQQRQLINYMVGAGQTSSLRQKLNEEFIGDTVTINKLRKKAKMSNLPVKEIYPFNYSFWANDFIRDQKNKVGCVQEKIKGKIYNLVVI